MRLISNSANSAASNASITLACDHALAGARAFGERTDDLDASLDPFVIRLDERAGGQDVQLSPDEVHRALEHLDDLAVEALRSGAHTHGHTVAVQRIGECRRRDEHVGAGLVGDDEAEAALVHREPARAHVLLRTAAPPARRLRGLRRRLLRGLGALGWLGGTVRRQASRRVAARTKAPAGQLGHEPRFGQGRESDRQRARVFARHAEQ
jgi:hypothetical protein